MGHVCQFLVRSVVRIVHFICGGGGQEDLLEEKENTHRRRYEKDRVVPDKNWYVTTLLQGNMFGKYVAEVKKRGDEEADSTSYIVKVYLSEQASMSEFIAMGHIGKHKESSEYLLLAHEWFYRDQKYFFIYEQEDVDLFTVLTNPSYNHISTNTHTLTFLRDALDAVAYMHDKHVVHYDLKFENMVMNLQTRRVRLIDFECCSLWSSPKRFCGTPGYVAPEIHLFHRVRDYDPGKQDVWSMGILAMLLVIPKSSPLLRPPKTMEGYKLWVENNIKQETDLFLKRCLHPDPKKRADIHEMITLVDTYMMKHRLNTGIVIKGG